MSGGVARRFGHQERRSQTRVSTSFVQRYTRFVGVMRRLLPAVAIALVAAVVAWPQFLPEERVQVGYNKKGMGGMGGHSLTVVNPRYYGVDSEQRPYSVLAEAAKQTKQDVIDLEQPRADLLLKDGSGLLLDARQGIYHQKAQFLQLEGNVNLFHEQGYEVHTQSAMIDLEAGAAEGSDPVDGHGPAIQLQGEGFRLADRGKTVFLTGKSHVVLYPDGRRQ